MATLTNTINFPRLLSGLDEQIIDRYLPFENKEIWIWNIAKTQTGYGHWKLKLEISIDGRKQELRAITTDSEMIDRWDNEDHEYGPGWQDAVYSVLRTNEMEMLDMAEPDIDEDEE